MKKQNFLQGALILVFASLVVKIFGAIFKIPLTNIIGVNAMAYFNTAYGFYVIFYMISTAGIPVALSKLVSEAEAKKRIAEIKKIFKVSLLMFFTLGVIGTAIMIVFSKPYSSYVHLDGLHLSIFSISITLFFMCITSAYRGYFQGLKNMTPTAVSQVIGACGKLFIGLLVAKISADAGLPSHLIAALTLLGITTGSIGSTVYLYFYKRKCDRESAPPVCDADISTSKSREIFGKIVSIAIPITLSATILSLTNTIDTTTMIRCLVDGGVDTLNATNIMGAYTSMSVPINNLAPNLIYPFAISIMPAITSLIASGKENSVDSLMNSALRIASIITIPCSLGLIAFSNPIITLLFDSDEIISYNGTALTAIEISSLMLSVLAISIFFIAIVSVTNALLQAYGLEKKTIISTTVGILLKLVLNYMLIPNEAVGLFGAPIATVACYASISVINLFIIFKYTNYRPRVFKLTFKPLISALVSILISKTLYNLYFSSIGSFGVVFAILLTVILYFTAIFAMKTVTNDDILMLPKGKKIEKLLIKLKLL